MALIPMEKSEKQTFYLDINNASMSAWGGAYQYGASVPVTINPTGKRIEAVFNPSDAFGAGVGGIDGNHSNRVDVTLFRGTQHNLTGRVYVTIYDD